LALAAAVTVSARAPAQTVTTSASAGHLELALHARSTRASARAEQAAWVTLTLPLDKLAAQRAAQWVTERKPLVRPALASAPPPMAAPRASLAADSPAPAPSAQPASPASPAPARPRLDVQQLRALADFTRRATVVALGAVGTAGERRRLDGLAARARSSALLPELRLRAVRNTDQALRWVPSSDDPYRVTQADGAGVILEASATFRLDRLLFAREELVVERLRLRAAEARVKLEARVQAALFGLFRARELGCSAEAEANDGERAHQLTKTLESFAELDDLTAGWFSDNAANLGRAVWGFPEAALGACLAPEPSSAPPATNPVASLEDSE
jgi:hypothetical protein